MLAQAQADVSKAQQDLKLQAIQNLEETAAARQKVERSQLELKDVQQGKGRLKEEEAAAAVSNAERELEKAQGAHDDLAAAPGRGLHHQAGAGARAAGGGARAGGAGAGQAPPRSLMTVRPAPRGVAGALGGAAHEGEPAPAGDERRATSWSRSSTAIAAAESRIQEAASKLALAQQQLARTEVRADVPGIVVYRDVFFGSEQRKPQVGDQVWANQPLLILPDISKMVVETSVRETDIHKIERNQSVAVRVQAYPDLKLTGQVTLVGTLAQEEQERRGAKFFGVTVQVNESEPRLRPGMTAPRRDPGGGARAGPVRAAGGRLREGRPPRLLRRARPRPRARAR